MHYCANGYTIVRRVYEGGHVSTEYFLDSKLVATFGGYRTETCFEGPTDFVEPSCVVVCSEKLCP